MNSKEIVVRCSCGDHMHELVMWYDADDSMTGEMYVMLRLPAEPLRMRIASAVRYLLGRVTHADGLGEVVLGSEAAKELIAFLQDYARNDTPEFDFDNVVIKLENDRQVSGWSYAGEGHESWQK